MTCVWVGPGTNTRHVFFAAACRNYVLAANLTAPFVLRARDFATGPSASGATFRVFDYFNAAAGGATLDDTHPFLIPTGTAQPSAPVTAVPLRYYVAAPVLPGGWVLYGEAGKVVPMAAKRTSGLVASAAGFSVEVAGASGGQNEAAGLDFWVIPPGAGAPVAVHCAAAATSTLACQTATLSCACAA